ncbi:protein spire homolog 1-like isoform X2 [Lethenteron reissneri]|uniref:protein spire homolog 1-like isoform X2 n=1 Tax=Lethenteron reissneri TaxID=7753 RepID=UPI002AB6D97F|nr:protein spire homolog 1-like isoform X2 [Lethenteron reissneri]
MSAAAAAAEPARDVVGGGGGPYGQGDSAEGGPLPLEAVLRAYEQPINEEQAWAVCFQACRVLAATPSGGGEGARDPGGGGGAGSSARPRLHLAGPHGVLLHRDGAVQCVLQPRDPATGETTEPCSAEVEVVRSLGFVIYKALDWGLDENEERELSQPLEELIDWMTSLEDVAAIDDEGGGGALRDEGYDGPDEDEEAGAGNATTAGTGTGTAAGTTAADGGSGVSRPEGPFQSVIKMCTSHLRTTREAPSHYQAVCRALYAEAMELRTFLEKIQSAKEALKKMQGGGGGGGDGNQASPNSFELNELQHLDWARLWGQVMRELRHGVKLKKVAAMRPYSGLPIEFQFTPYEMLMDDIRAKRYNLRKVMVNGDIPQRVRKSAHDVILEFIRSRPPLNPVAFRKLRETPERPRSLHEQMLDEIRMDRKLRPVSPVLPQPCRTALRPLSMSQSFDLADIDTPDGRRVRKKKLLKAPTLAEMEAEFEEEQEEGNLGDAGTLDYLGDMSPFLRDAGPRDRRSLHLSFMPVSLTPQPERRLPGPRRHSIEKETPTTTAAREFPRPVRQDSRSLSSPPVAAVGGPLLASGLWRAPPPVAAMGGALGLSSWPLEVSLLCAAGLLCKALHLVCSDAPQWAPLQDEFSFPVESLALTVEEVMHIRQVLVKAELEKFQQYKEIYTALKKGKMCFCCRSKRFSLFTWAYTCHFCKRPVCSQCCKKMRFPTKHIGHIPIYSLGAAGLSGASSPTAPPPAASSSSRSTPAPRRTVSMRERATPSPALGGSGGGGWRRRRRRGRLGAGAADAQHSRLGCVDVCVDCRRFVADIIRSSRNPFHGDRRAPWLRRYKTRSLEPSADARKLAGGAGGGDGLAAATSAAPPGVNRGFHLAVPRETPIKEV